MEASDGSPPSGVGPSRVGGSFTEDLPVAFDVPGVHLRRLVDPLVVRTVLAVLFALIVVLWPGPTERVIVRLAGVGAMALGLTTFWQLLRTRARGVPRVVQAVAWTSVGVLLAVGPRLSISVAGRAVAVAVLAVAVVGLAGAWRRRDEVGRAWPSARTILLVVLAGFLFARPGALLAIALVTGAVAVAVVGIVAVSRSIGSDDGEQTTFADAGHIVIAWLYERPKTLVDRDALLDSLFYEGRTGRARVARFFVLMVLSAVIAAGGVLIDSTATVIGAMLVAPLMTPLMAVAVSVVMGWPNRLTRAATLALAAAVLVVVIGLLFSAIAPITLDPTTNAQILSRTSPTIPDLIVAIAAGAAGAFGLSRPGLSGALPGVAIAISLVPPLAVVGITAGAGAGEDSLGALLLFASNALAIVIVGGVTFVITGLTPLRSFGSNQQRVRTAAAAIVTLAVFVVAALALNGRQLASNAIELGKASNAVTQWLETADETYGVLTVSVQGDTVTVTIVGPPDGAPPTTGLQQTMIDALGRDVTIELATRLQTVETLDPP